VCFSGEIKENSRRVKEKARNREEKEENLLQVAQNQGVSLKLGQARPKVKVFSPKRDTCRHSRSSDAGARLSERSCSGDPPLPPFSPKRVQMLPISLKRDPFFSLKYSARLSEMLASAHLAQARGFLWDEEMLSRSSETEVA